MTLNSKTLFFGLTVLVVVAFASLSLAQSPYGKGTGQQHDLIWLYDSPLTVTQEIVDLGEGQFQYSFGLENVDDKQIWHFGVYTKFEINGEITAWEVDDGPWFISNTNDLDEIHPEVYDARNLDQDIVAICSLYCGIWPNNPNPVQPSGTVEGFKFVAGTYDISPKLYYYETVEDGYAANTGIIAAGGLSEPATVSVQSTSWGGVKSLFR
jgi:hypothetical protein